MMVGGDVVAEDVEQVDNRIMDQNEALACCRLGIRDGGIGNGYQKRGHRTDFMDDPEVIAKRKEALARKEAAE
jgi:hypothetical protein